MDTPTIFAGVAGLAIGILLGAALRRRPSDRRATPTSAPQPPDGGARDPYQLQAAARNAIDAAALPEDALTMPAFVALVELLQDPTFDERRLVRYFDGSCPALASAAAVALDRRGASPDAIEGLLREVNDVHFFARAYALAAVRHHAPGSALAPLIARLDDSFESSWGRRVLSDHLESCFREHDDVDVEAIARAVEANDELENEAFATLVAHLPRSGAAIAARLTTGADDAAEAAPGARDRDTREPALPKAIRGFARVLEPGVAQGGIVVDAIVTAQIAAMHRALEIAPRRSVVLVGDAGSGKDIAVRAYVATLSLGTTVFEAAAVDLLAGQSYIGQLEGRLQALVGTFQTARQPLLWIVPGVHELLWAGQHRQSPTGVLDTLLPMIAAGTIRVIGLARSDEWERLVRERPAVRTVFEVVRIEPRSAEAAIDLARARHGARCSGAILREAATLAQQYLDDGVLPGSLVRLLELAAREADDGPITREHLLAAVGVATGLPRDILDDDARLDVAAVRRFFEERVLGQPEAIDALIERLTLIKAGLDDHARPQGVFLFTGPTGTGKTEIVRALAEWLFGSPERTIRVDMSELQDRSALSRILGEGGTHDGGDALVDRVRQQPFSVVLLDEFEKADPRVWDLFLQVFDAGRLSDRRGRRTDFRHTIVVMTSNVGAAAAQSGMLGFGATANAAVARDLAQTFRPEFLNRIDRIVVFRPLDERIMRRILEKELRAALERRGLRSRQWAVEWDGTALDFLVRAGFSPDQGARPLRRAIETHLLAPLARTIVANEAPAGDQFLFVRSNGRRIDVEFVDPDGPDDTLPADTTGTQPDLAAIALDGTGSPTEFALLCARQQTLADLAESESWRSRKATALAHTADPDFWTSTDRFAVLDAAEYVDRIETGIRTASRLVGRLRGRGRTHYDRRLVRRLAQPLWLLERAIRDVEESAPHDALLQIEALREGADSDRFAERIRAMYLAWGERRGMTVEVLEEAAATADHAARAVLAISGFGAFSILAPEAGLHVFERPAAQASGVERLRARVAVAPHPLAPAGDPGESLRAARAALDARPLGPEIVRRYREEPSPLVRDAIRGWRTGRLDRVLAGDFDLIG